MNLPDKIQGNYSEIGSRTGKGNRFVNLETLRREPYHVHREVNPYQYTHIKLALSQPRSKTRNQTDTNSSQTNKQQWYEEAAADLGELQHFYSESQSTEIRLCIQKAENSSKIGHEARNMIQ